MSQNLEVSSSETVKIGEWSYTYDQNGFLKQDSPQAFDYDLEYKAQQSTNPRMSWLRLGWLSAHIPYDSLSRMNAVDIGAGNGTFVREAASVLNRIVPYDLAGESIDDIELYATNWDLIVMSDVLEHYYRIDDLWRLQFQYAMISFPETPDPKTHDLSRWRHFKPDEHIYMLTADSVAKWVARHGYKVVARGNPEDTIRRRWHDTRPNISTLLIKREVLRAE